jgi:hypothetical protein
MDTTYGLYLSHRLFIEYDREAPLFGVTVCSAESTVFRCTTTLSVTCGELGTCTGSSRFRVSGSGVRKP